MRVKKCHLDEKEINDTLASLERGNSTVKDIKFPFSEKEAWILYMREERGEEMEAATEAAQPPIQKEASWKTIAETIKRPEYVG